MRVVPNVVLVLVVIGAVQASVIASFTNTEKGIPRRRKAAYSTATLAGTALGGDIVIIQRPTEGVLQGDAVEPVSGISRVISKRHNGSVGATFHGLEVELALGVEVGGGVDAAGVGGREERHVEGEDGGAGVNGGAEVVEGGVTEGRGE